jgi:hypothetical protein
LSGAGSAGGLASAPGGPFNRSATTRGQSGCAAREVPAVITSKAQITKHFIIGEPRLQQPQHPAAIGRFNGICVSYD